MPHAHPSPPCPLRRHRRGPRRHRRRRHRSSPRREGRAHRVERLDRRSAHQPGRAARRARVDRSPAHLPELQRAARAHPRPLPARVPRRRLRVEALPRTPRRPPRRAGDDLAARGIGPSHHPHRARPGRRAALGRPHRGGRAHRPPHGRRGRRARRSGRRRHRARRAARARRHRARRRQRVGRRDRRAPRAGGRRPARPAGGHLVRGARAATGRAARHRPPGGLRRVPRHRSRLLARPAAVVGRHRADHPRTQGAPDVRRPARRRRRQRRPRSVALPAHPVAAHDGRRVGGSRRHPGELAADRLLGRAAGRPRGHRRRPRQGARGCAGAHAVVRALDPDRGPPQRRRHRIPRAHAPRRRARHLRRAREGGLRARVPAHPGPVHRHRGAHRARDARGGRGFGAVRRCRGHRLLPHRPAPVDLGAQLRRHRLLPVPDSARGPHPPRRAQPAGGEQEHRQHPHHERRLPAAPRGVVDRRGGGRPRGVLHERLARARRGARRRGAARRLPAAARRPALSRRRPRARRAVPGPPHPAAAPRAAMRRDAPRCAAVGRASRPTARRAARRGPSGRCPRASRGGSPPAAGGGRPGGR